MLDKPFFLRTVPALAVAVLVPTLALAQMDRHGRLIPGNAGTPVAAAADAGAAPATPAADAGAVSLKETPAQYRKREDYVEKTNLLIRNTVKANGKAVTEEERTEVLKHWRWSMRLYRIREIAEDLNDAAAITRADAGIQNADTKFYAALKVMNARAPKADGGTK